ncbi:MAG: hypothetical protein R2800_07575 [Flavipsychrobacter sp.]
MRFILLVLLALPSIVVAQPYELSYDKDDMPELYNNISVYVSDQSDATSTTKGVLYYQGRIVKRNNLHFEKKDLYAAEGKLPFTLKTGGKEIPLTLELPILDDIRFNLYTDSIKPVLNYYLNIEGIFTNGRIFPLDTSLISVSCSAGAMDGFTWLKPETINFDKVTFTAICKYNPAIAQHLTIYIQRATDPRDEPDYEDQD